MPRCLGALATKGHLEIGLLVTPQRVKAGSGMYGGLPGELRNSTKGEGNHLPTG